MSSVLITSFFTKNGVPQVGLSPLIRIWEVSDTSRILVVGSPDGIGDPGTGVGTDGVMIEVVNQTGSPLGSPVGSPGPSRDGFYNFTFTAAMGYDETKNYSVRSDGGNSIPQGERYQTVVIDPTCNIIENKVDSVKLDSTAILTIVKEILKYDRNRTLIDKNAFTLTVFDNDGTTPLRVFDLKDDNGIASITSIFERIPVVGSP